MTRDAGAALAEVYVNILREGASIASDFTAPDGTYAVQRLPAGTYLVRPYREGYTFSPPDHDVTISDQSISGLDFIASQATTTPTRFSISGTIRDEAGIAVPGVTVTATAGSSSYPGVSAESGMYEIMELPPGTYTVTPSRDGMEFVPVSQSVTVGDAAVGGVEFTARATAQPATPSPTAPAATPVPAPTPTPVATLTPPATPTPTPDLSSRTKIAFVSDRDGNQEIYVMNGDGTGQTRMTDNPASDYSPCWSPDGAKIAFASLRDGSYGIFVMSADGSSQVRLTNSVSGDSAPSWSPDGAKVAFASWHDRDLKWEVHVINADGTGDTNITKHWGPDDAPSWSPDGASIAYCCNHYPGAGVYVMNPDGSGKTNLTNSGRADTHPCWSHGRRIAFKSDRDGNDEVYVMNADGSGQNRLTNDSASDRYPCWSPDGTKIVFDSNRSGNCEIYSINVDGSGPTNLTNNSATDEDPAWSPWLTQSSAAVWGSTRPALSHRAGRGLPGALAMSAYGQFVNCPYMLAQLCEAQ